MAVCREVDTGRIELLLPVKVSFVAFSPCPVLALSSICFVQSAGDIFGTIQVEVIWLWRQVSFSGIEGSRGGSGASRPAS